MVHYKLTYFNVRGLGEAIRYILHYGGKDFEDERLSFDDWKDKKAKTPFGQLPVLEIDGKQTLCQSSAIARYLAKEIGIAGSNNYEQAQVDMYVDGFKDLFPKALPWFMELRKKFMESADNEDKIKETFNTFKCEALIPFLDLYEIVLTSNGTGWLVGANVTWADMIVAEFLEKLTKLFDAELLSKHSKLAQMVKKVHELPGIREYCEKRPDTQI